MLRSFEATDDCGNTSMSSQTINVVDDAAPVVVDGPCFGEGCALNINELNGESVPMQNLTIADNCDAEATWSLCRRFFSSWPHVRTDCSDLHECRMTAEIRFPTTSASTSQRFSRAAWTQRHATTMQMPMQTQGTVISVRAAIMHAVVQMKKACNYDASAVYEDGSCEYPLTGFDCDGVCFDINANGICDFENPDVRMLRLATTTMLLKSTMALAITAAGTTSTSSEAGYGVDIELVQTRVKAIEGLRTYRVYVTTPTLTTY